MYLKTDAIVGSDQYLSTYNIMRLGDIAFEGNKSKDFAHGRFVENYIGDGIVSHVFNVFRPISAFDLSFRKYQINNEMIMGPKLLRCTKSSTMMTDLVPGDFLDEYLSVPSLEEQRLVGSFLDRISCLITLHQRKLEKIKCLKKALLEKMFPGNGEEKPRIRFKGFVDPWEQRELSGVAGVYDGVHQTPAYQDEGIMFLSVENIATLSSEKYISEEAYNRDYKVHPEKGDILMTRIGDVGTPNVVETSEKLAYYVSLALLKPKGIDSYFLNNAIQSSSFRHGLRERTLLTAIPMKINKDEIGTVDIIYPVNKDEQRKIGECFKQLDNLIALHQRKLEKLKNIKKSLLEKMFVA